MRLRLLLFCVAASLAACGDSDGTTIQRPAPISGPVTATAAAPERTLDADLRTGSISGRVDVPAHAPGPCFVAAASRPDQLVVAQAAAVASVRADGTFTLANLAPGTYYVAAYLDANGNRRFDYGGEPYVAWPDEITVGAGAPASGIALSNFLNLANPQVRTEERGAEVAHLYAAAEAAFQNLLLADLPPDADTASVVPTLRMLIAECGQRWATAADEETYQFVRDTLAAVPGWIDTVRRGEDPFAGQRGWQLRAFVRAADQAVVPYLLYVPPSYDGATPLPLVLGLHGGGGSHWTGAHMVVGSEGLSAFGPDRVPGVWPADPQTDMFIVTPTGDRTASLVPWRAMGEVNAMGAVAEVRRRYAVDENRVYLTGLSDGGRGAWELGVRYPDQFAAMIIGCGATDAAQALCMNVAHIPTRIVHGTHDQIIPVWNARNMVDVGKAYNARFEYEEVDRGHNIGDIVYDDGAAFAWFAPHRRDPVPPLVRYRTNSVQYGAGAGLTITALGTPDTLADVQVEWQDANTVRVDSRNVGGLTLRVPPGAGDAITVQWNAQTFTVPGRPPGIHMEANLTDAGEVEWSATAADPPPTAPPGAWAQRQVG